MKGSIQLSANFIVVMVLTLLVIGMGFAIFGEIFQNVVKLPEQIDDKCEQYLGVILKDTDYAFCEANIEIEQGKTSYAWLGIVNSFDNPKVCYKVKVRVEDGGIDAENGGLLPESNIQSLPLIISSGDTDYLLISISAKDVEKDNYALDVEIWPSEESSCTDNTPELLNDLDSSEFPKIRKLFVTVR